MTGGTLGHSGIMGNVLTALRTRLRGSPCRSFNEAGVETVNNAIRYPDVLITCSEIRSEDRLTPGVVAVFEVISPTSGRIDRIVKVQEYLAVPTIRRYVIVESAFIGLTVMERSGSDEIWRTTTLNGQDTLRMPDIGIAIPVAEIYEDITFPEAEASSA
jgi:Uma2 family endonuclease